MYTKCQKRVRLWSAFLKVMFNPSTDILYFVNFLISDLSVPNILFTFSIVSFVIEIFHLVR